MQVQRNVEGVVHTFENIVGFPFWVRRTRAPLSLVVVAHQIDFSPQTVDYHDQCGWCRLGMAHTSGVHVRSIADGALR